MRRRRRLRISFAIRCVFKKVLSSADGTSSQQNSCRESFDALTVPAQPHVALRAVIQQLLRSSLLVHLAVRFSQLRKVPLPTPTNTRANDNIVSRERPRTKSTCSQLFSCHIRPQRAIPNHHSPAPQPAQKPSVGLSLPHTLAATLLRPPHAAAAAAG